MPTQPSPSRLEAFSDGVIAVIITIMVLDLKVPLANGLPGFVSVLPTIAVYLLSFVFTGIYWVNHHHLIDRLKRVDHLILWSNLGFLFCLSLLPFSTNYMVVKHNDSFSVALYAASLVLTAVSFLLLGRAIVRHLLRQIDTYTAEEACGQAQEIHKGLISLTIYCGAIPLAYWHPWAAFVVIALATLPWIVPTFGIRPSQHDPSQNTLEPT